MNKYLTLATFSLCSSLACGMETSIPDFNVETKGLELLIMEALQKGADINEISERGRTFLMFATSLDNEKLVELLIKKGADVNAQDSNGETALIIALLFGQEAIAKFLIAHGAHVNVATHKGTTPLMIATLLPHISLQTMQLLINRGANVNACDKQGSTALLIARQCGFQEKAALLEKYTKKPTLTRKKSFTF
jgi:uncharacterized protein